MPDPLDSLRRLQVGQQSSQRDRAVDRACPLNSQLRVDANMSALNARYDDFTEVVGGVLTSWNGKTPDRHPQRDGEPLAGRGAGAAVAAAGRRPLHRGALPRQRQHHDGPIGDARRCRACAG